MPRQGDGSVLAIKYARHVGYLEKVMAVYWGLNMPDMWDI